MQDLLKLKDTEIREKLQTYTVQGWEKINENLTKSIIFTKYIKIIVRVSCHFQMAVKLYKLKKLYWAREPHVHCSCTHFSILWFQNLGRVPRQGEHGRVLGPQIIGRISGLKISWESRRRAFQVVTDSSASPR